MTLELTVKVDRKSVDNAIKEMDIFRNTKAAIGNYDNELKLIKERETELKKQLNELQTKLTENLLLLDSEKSVTKVIELKKQNHGFVQDSKMIESLLEEIQEDKTSLKLQYAPIYKKALREDSTEANQYNVNPLVNQMKYEMLKAVADLGVEMKRQYFEINHDVQEVFEDSEVQAVIHPKPRFDFENYTPRYSEFSPTVIAKGDVFSAVSGNVPKKSKN